MSGREDQEWTLFLLQPEHLALLARANVYWQDYRDRPGRGAPAIDPKRTYSGFSTDLFGDIAAVVDPAGWEQALRSEYARDAYEAANAAAFMRWHRETELALLAVLRGGARGPGVYRHDPRRERWEWAGPLP